MNDSRVENLGAGIHCIDALYTGPGVACCYLLENAGEVAIIETGTAHTADAIAELLSALNLADRSVRYIIPTHVHLDHAGGAGVLMQRYPEAQLVIHPRGARHMVDPSKLIAGTIAVYGEQQFSELYGEILPIAEDRLLIAEDGCVLDLAGRPLEVRHTPGHAEHHFCIWDCATRGWFSGDTFGLCYQTPELGGGRFILPTTTPVQFAPDRLLASIELMMSYQPQRIYMTHYSVLEQPEMLVNSLCEQIEEYQQIALALVDMPDRQARIADRLQEMTQSRIKAAHPSADLGVVIKKLKMDFELNAQGLDVWLTKQQEQ